MKQTLEMLKKISTLPGVPAHEKLVSQYIKGEIEKFF